MGRQCNDFDEDQLVAAVRSAWMRGAQRARRDIVTTIKPAGEPVQRLSDQHEPVADRDVLDGEHADPLRQTVGRLKVVEHFLRVHVDRLGDKVREAAWRFLLAGHGDAPLVAGQVAARSVGERSPVGGGSGGTAPAPRPDHSADLRADDGADG